MYQGLRVWISGGKAAIAFSSMEIVRQPMAPELRALVARANLSRNLSGGTAKLRERDGLCRCSVFTPVGDYDQTIRAIRSLSWIPSVVYGGKLLPGNPGQNVYHWTAGGEVVLVSSRVFPLTKLESHKRRNERHFTLGKSSLQWRKLLPTVLVLGFPDVLATPRTIRTRAPGSMPTLVAAAP